MLTRIDADLATQVQAQGCACGGALHRANYPRKVRGMNVEANRDSFCCAEEGCRRRRTPGSVRFLGRRVYAGFIVVLLTALQHGLSVERVRVLQEQFGVDRREAVRGQAVVCGFFGRLIESATREGYCDAIRSPAETCNGVAVNICKPYLLQVSARPGLQA